MKPGLPPPARKGFTLVELMVAMAITTIMVTILVTITSMSLDTWNRSRAEVRAARQAKAMVEIMARDFEAMVTRSGNNHQWLVAESGGSGAGQSPNSANLIFFTAATDRYNGAVGTASDAGGDISAVGYQLKYVDPIRAGGADRTFVLYRRLVDPNVAFQNLIGQDDLKAKFAPYFAELDDGNESKKHFVCENIYQFSMTFHVETTAVVNNVATLRSIPVTMGQGSATAISIRGGNLEITPPNAAIQPGSRIVAVEVSLTVLSDNAANTLRNGATVRPEFIRQNSFQYSKRIEVPRP
jgi:prepilin-type N-terminal cleavage/methylation domain-containing protein